MERAVKDRQVRAQLTRFETREEEERPQISGYFSVFDGVFYIRGAKIWPRGKTGNGTEQTRWGSGQIPGR